MRSVSCFALLGITLSIWNSVASAAHGLVGRACFEACQFTLSGVKFTDCNDTASCRTGQCQTRLGLTSLYLCTSLHCSEPERIDGLQALNSTCRALGHPAVPPFDMISNYTDEDIQRLRRLEKEEAMGSGMAFGEVVLPSDHFYTLAIDTKDAWAYVHHFHVLYGSSMFFFWAIVCFIGMSFRATLAIVNFSATRQRPDACMVDVPQEFLDDDLLPPEKGAKRSPRAYVWLKRYLTIPATFGHRTAQPFGWYTVPPRVQTLTIFAFVIMNVVFCASGYWVFSDNLYWPKVSTQAWRYVSDRTGIISVANFPLIWLFGMRNNALLWLTGWDFGTYNNFHRWVARVATVEAIIHSVGYSALVIQRGGWTLFAGYWRWTFWWTGELATVFMCLLLPMSIYWMRRNYYEAFLIVHILLSLLTVGAMWRHVHDFRGPWNVLLSGSLFIWGLDRILRWLRILWFNPTFWTTKATAVYDPQSNMVQLSIPKPNRLYRAHPGTFYYIYALNTRRFWESHPFTMATLQTNRLQSQVDAQIAARHSSDVSGEDAIMLLNQGDDVPLDETAQYLAENTPTLNFWIRPYNSFTKRLKDAGASAYPTPASLRLLVEGPYGHSQPYHRFKNILFIVGGSGIVVPLPYMVSLCAPDSQVKSIRIVWAVREASFATRVVHGDLRPALSGDKVSLDIYITKVAVGEPEWEEFDLAEDLKQARILRGRPDVAAEVEEAVREADLDRLAVVACGPARMADDARRAVVDVLGKWQAPVEYFQESFNW